MLVFPQISNNIMKKCKYFNNHQSACTLMIDDLVPDFFPLRDQKPLAKYDWGFYMDNENSLFNYFYV